MLASDVNNPGFAGAHDPDAVMIARFYVRAVKNNFKSAAEARPIFENKIYCEYYPAGSTLLKMDIPARDDHKQRFSKQWEYFQRTQNSDGMQNGTPIDQWPLLTPADVENLKGIKFHTVDQIAAASDSMIQIFGMGIAGLAPHVFRARAQAYLSAAKDTALPQKQAEDIEALKKQVADLTALLTKAASEPEPVAAPTKRVWTAEEKAAAGARLKKAREAKQAKVT